MFDHPVGLATFALVSVDSFNQIGRPTIMEKKDTLSNTPERSRSEVVRSGRALRNSIREAFSHVVHEQIRKEVYSLV